MGADERVAAKPEEREERALVLAAQGGDEAAFEELLLRIRSRVFWLSRQVVGNAEEAKDVTQSVFIRLWRVLPRYDPRYPFSTWLHRITMNLAIDSLRRGAPQRRDCELDEALVAEAPDAAGRPASPESSARDTEVWRIFDELKDQLPPQQRAVFALKEMEGHTAVEVGEILGLSASTVRNHLFQARRTLRTELTRRYPEYLPRFGKTT